MEVLLVSPAKTWQVIVAKMLVGVFYGSIAAMGLLLLNNYLIVNWGIAILASLGTILFAGAIGTLVGILSENPTTTGMWGGLVILAVLATTFLRFFENVNMPPALQILVDWSPGASMLNLFGAAMTMEISPDALISNLAILLGVGLVIYLLAGMFFARKVR
jgi:ABC-type multidrug transport system permease subunit